MAPRIALAGPERFDALRPLWLQDDETSWTARRSALLDAVDAELAARGITDLLIGVMEGNHDARRLYERRGLVPGWRQLYRVAAASR